MNKKTFMAAIIISVLLISPLLVVNMVNANPNIVVFPDRPNMTLPILTVQTPTQNGSYPKNNVFLDFNVTKPDNTWFWGGYGVPPSSAVGSISYYLDGVYTSVFFSNAIDDRLPRTSHYVIELDNLAGGKHEVGIEVIAQHFYGGYTTSPQRIQNTQSVLVSFNVDDNPTPIPTPSIIPLPSPSPSPSLSPTPSPTQRTTQDPSPTPESTLNSTPSQPLTPSSILTPTIEPTLENSPSLDIIQNGDFTPAILLSSIILVAVTVGVIVYFKKYHGKKQS